MSKLGHKQQSLVEIGKHKGYITSIDVDNLYSKSEGKRVMNTLIALGYFGKPEDDGLKIVWRYVRKG